MSKKFKFSIIISLFESQSYLNESLDSIINQSLNFEDNVQIIIVDNGSIDNSNEIVSQYKSKYPNNIVLLSKENKGFEDSCNYAINYIEGEYVNFLLANDKLSKNALKEVYNFFKNHYNEIDLVNLPVILFTSQMKKNYLEYTNLNKKLVINLDENPIQSILPYYSNFIKSDLIKNIQFDTNLVSGALTLKITEILLKKRSFGAVYTSRYFFRKRNTDDRFVEDPLSKRNFTEKIKLFYLKLIDISKDNNGKVPNFVQHIIIKELTEIVLVEDLCDYLDTQEEVNEFWDYFHKILPIFDEEFVYSDNKVRDSVKSFLIYLKNKEFHIETYPDKNEVYLKTNDYIICKLHRHVIRFDIVNFHNGVLNFSGSVLSRCDNSTFYIEAVKTDEKGNESVYKSKFFEYVTTGRKTRKFLGIWWNYYHHFDVSVPVNDDNKCEINFRLVYNENGQKVVMYNRIGFRQFPGMSNFNNYFVKESKIIYFKLKTFYYEPFSYKRMLLLEGFSIGKIILKKEEDLKLGLFYKLARLILFPFMQNRNIWLFIDRDEVADDNAEQLFKYTYEIDDNIKKYFLIKDDSPDYKRLKADYGSSIVPFSSIKHKLLYFFADKIISSQITRSLINPFAYKNTYIFEGLSSHEYCFIQHGVILHDLSSWIRKYNRQMLLFVTSSPLEHDSIVNGYYNYGEDVVQTLGLARYDNLVDDSKNEILFMPTWRRKLDTEDQFINSDYFKYLKSFLNNEKLIEFLDKKGYTLVFRPHPNLWKFIDLFDLNDNIKISDVPYRDMFRDASLMVTDYSSVFFDFAYLKKPVLYYQNESFDDFHYGKGYFDYETMAFGEIVHNEDDLVKMIMEYVENDCKMKDKYKSRVDKFFKFNDRNNRKRLYDWIKNH